MENQFGSQWPLHHFTHFHIESIEKSNYIIESGGTFQISGKIKNNVQEYATTYIIIKFANADNQHEIITFDSDRDFNEGEKESLRIVDIPPLGGKDFCVQIKLPEDIERQTLDMRIELWSPARRTWSRSSIDTIALFYRSNWGNGIDIIKKEDLIATVFISYSWFSDEHVKWVSKLAQELARRQIKATLDQKDLELGQPITKFMEKGIKSSICICVCSEAYTKKANDESSYGGVEYEISILSNQVLKGRLRSTIIPIIKDNPEKLLPDFLGSAKYINMDTEQWDGIPLTELARTIIKLSS
ncbi:TIR domain-containing protein [Flavobacterium fontis]|uniref:TIR domain-containing protein n=1 Tax=Flavobacterium fontis TaxID=1124188 RepID=A0A1M5EC31_9FLAO|nr:toll/interleukin-1 receptor domain-containing protein [Flavobacterium fontis]SHF76694.1 TIR domain-containing protein [Flavobacterium fontis]